jgi:hypothetical protein
MSLEQEAADLLERAADGYESGRYYWTRGQYSRMVFGTQAYCSLGALGHEAGLTNREIREEEVDQTPALTEAVNALARVVVNNDFYAIAAVVSWNDRMQWVDDKRVPLGKEAVVQAMKYAAKELHNKTGETV